MALNWNQHRREAEQLAEQWKPSATGGDTTHSERYITALATVANLELAAETRRSATEMAETAKWTRRLAYFTAGAVLVGLLGVIVALWK